MNFARIRPRLTLWLALAWATLALSGCFSVAAPTPDAVPLVSRTPTALPIPTAALDNTSWLPQTVISPPTIPAPTANAPTVTADDYQNDELGVIWLRPGAGWTFYDATGLEGTFGQLVPLVTLAHDDEASPRFVTLLRAELPPLIVRTFAQMIETSPDLALQSLAAGMGDLGNLAQLAVSELGGLPAVYVMLDTPARGRNFIWIVGRPQAVFYILAEGFRTPDELAPVLQELRFITLTPAERALADGSPPAPAETRAQLVAIAEELRGISTLSPVPFRFMPRADLQAMLQTRTTEETDLDKTAASQALLKLLGLLPPDADLLAILLDFYGAEIAGYYDQQADTFFLIGDGQAADAPLGLRDQVVFIHEYAHALHDQHFDLAHLLDAEQQGASDDAVAAFLALVEGDAQMVTSLYVINYVGLEQTEALVAEASRQMDREVLEQTPPFIRDSAILFPYVHGQAFVQQLFLNGGWEAINAAWQAPPVSTEQILHPEKYPNDRPVAVSLPTTLPAALAGGWHEALRNVWGEYSLRLWLADALADDATDAAAGWDGDQYLYLTDGTHGLFVLQMVWDTSEDADEGAAALRQWLATRGLEATSTTRYASDAYNGYLNVQFSRLFFAFADDARALNLALATLGWR